MNELNNKQKNKLEENACSITTTYTQRNQKYMSVAKRFHFKTEKKLLSNWILHKHEHAHLVLDIENLCAIEMTRMNIRAYYDVICEEDGRCICGNIPPDTAYCHMDDTQADVDKRQKELSEKDGEE